MQRKPILPKLEGRQKKEAIKRPDHGEEPPAEISRGYNVNGWTTVRLVWVMLNRHLKAKESHSQTRRGR